LLSERPGAPHLARFSRDVGYHRPQPRTPKPKTNPEETGRVPLVRQTCSGLPWGVRGPKKTGRPGFPATGRHRHPRVRLSSKKAAWSSSTPTRSTVNPGEAPPKPFTKAYPEPAVTLLLLRSVGRRSPPTTIVALLLALVVTQSASFVCSAQCLQHLQASQTVGEMTHCHSMLPSDSHPAAQTCPPTATSFCVTDLLASDQQKTLVPTIQPDVTVLLPNLTIAAHAPVFPPLRSTIGDPPLITPLRI
jgi:hypothetical protein